MPAANAYVQLAEDTARRITHSHMEWTGFLKTAARLYKYPYHEQLMIYAQRPEATACAGYRVWNDRMRRYIRRGSKGIALLDVSGDEPKLRYVFDVADTGVRASSRPFSQWRLTEQNEEAARRALEDGYDVTGSLEKQIHAAVQQLVMNQWLDHRREILGIVDGSYLEGYDEFNVGASFRKAAAVSAEYALLSRCGRNPDERFVHEDFLPIFDWNTPEAVTVLGTAVSEMSEEVLRTIEIAVRNHERSLENEPDHLSAKRGLPDSQPDHGENGEAAGPVRTDAERLPAEASAHAVPVPASDGETVSAPAGDRGNGEQADGAAPAAADGTVRSDGTAQSRRYDEVGRADEQLQGPGRRNDSERADLQLNQTVQLSFFPTEEAQIVQIDHAESVQPSALSFAASVSEEEAIQALQAAVSEPASRMRVATEFSKGKSIPELILTLQKEYQGGTGITTPRGSLSIWCDERGLALAHGDSAREHPFAAHFSWEEAAERIGSLLEQGRYATVDELAQMENQERMELAQSLLYLRQDMTKEAVEMLPALDQFQNIWPENQQKLAEFLTQSEGRRQLQTEMERFSAAYEQNRSLLRFPLHPPAPLLKRLQELELPRIAYSSDLLEAATPSFITQDEIDAALAQGSNMEGGRERIARYFAEKHPLGEKADFLKKEYGTGGRSHALTGKSGSSMDYDAKGIRLHKTGCPEVALKWNMVAQRMERLVQKGLLLSEEKQKEANSERPSEQQDFLPLPYRTGDTVYLDDTAFQITEVTRRHVQMQDLTLPYPLFRSENRNRFESLLRLDRWNQAIVDLLPAPTVDNGLRDLLMNGILPAQMQEQIAGLLQGGATNPSLAGWLAASFDQADAGSMTLETGEEADFFTGLDGFEAEIHGEKSSQTLGLSWQDAAPLLRTVYQEKKPIVNSVLTLPNLEATVTQPDFERLRPQLEAQSIDFGEFPQENGDVKITFSAQHYAAVQALLDALPEEELPLPQQETRQATPPAENFHITDDHLGEGGAKTKYGWNLAAIRTLQQLESENRPATPEEQEILSRYVGWGGLSQAFDPQNADWKKEYEELKGLLSASEYASARASALNAHYTSPTVIRAMYEAIGRMGFTSGNILEPACGVGNFFGLLPDSVAGSRLYGVELDSLTGRIARQLYPQANITVAGFETTDRRDFFDLAIGNVPFGNYQVSDKPYDKLHFPIHDYFFAKALDQVRPGGVVAFITSKGTMDKQNPDVRRYIARRAELLGAVRLPNNAFKANAGTEVTSDILFLQKRERPIDVEPDWVHLSVTEDGIPLNAYFAEHPEMVLGRMAWDGSMYGSRQETACIPLEGTDLAEQLATAMQNITGQITEMELPDLAEDATIDTSLPADPDVKNFSYTVVEGEVYYRENSRMLHQELSEAAKERVKGLVGLRDCVRSLIDQQMENAPDKIIQRSQAELNARYDAFTAQYGLINSRGNANAFASDSSYYLLCSLEILDENHQLSRKADLFTKRTIRPAQAVEHVDTAAEALAVSIAERASVDMPYMTRLSGKSEEELAKELQGVVFPVPDSADEEGHFRYVTADEYLSGNIREKLAAAEAAALTDARFAVNAESLRQAMPKPLEASEIDVRLGATWIDKSYIQQFMEETLETPFYMCNKIRVNYSPVTAEWNISNKGTIRSNDVTAYSTYGTEYASAYKILEDTLNLRDVRIYDTVRDVDGNEKRVLNKNATTLAQQKQQAIKDAFQDWVWQDADRRRELSDKYNELFNSTRPREYDGSHITFSGMNPEIALRPHQRDAIAHILYGGNTLLAHEVGAGKTFEMVAAVMESKRLGLCNKALFAVPKHLTEQWSSEFLRLYPSANILVATKKDFETKNRKKFCARIATGDYDAIIMGHSQFERIPVSVERQERLLDEQIMEIEEGIEELKSANAERFTIKQAERTKKMLEARLKKLNDSERKDDVVTFEQLGVDRLYVDEAHNYKNCFLYTKMRNVAGLAATDAQKSSDMLMKCRYMDEITGGRGTVFATGTPVSNSMTELYTMQRYLQHDALKRNGMSHFDCWASTFGETVTSIELAPEGTGYRARTRFARFFNLPELMTLFKETADIKTADVLNLPTPEAVYHNVVAQPTEIQKELVQKLSERAADVHSGNVEPNVDNMLKITSDGRKLGLDQRLINPMLPDEPGSKVNLCVENIARIYREGDADKLTQLVFCDLSTPKGDGSFTVYDDIRQKLIAKGIPESEIAFIHEANTEVRKKELFARVRSGQVRVLMGSTSKMGAGTNVRATRSRLKRLRTSQK